MISFLCFCIIWLHPREFSGPSFTFYKKSDSTRPHQNMDNFVVYLPLFYIMGFKIS